MKIMRVIALALALSVSLYAVLIGYMALTASDEIYHFDMASPSDPVAPFQTVSDPEFHGWHAPGEKAPVLVLVGNTGKMTDGAKRAAPLLDAGHEVLILSYPGTRPGDAAPSEDRIIDAALAAREWLAQETRQTPFVYGLSLGAAVGAAIAQESDVRALMMEAPFTSVYDIAKTLYPFIPPIDILPENGWRSIDRMPSITVPVLVLHGERDRVIPIQHGRMIAAIAPNSEMITYQEGRHWNLGLLGAGDDIVKFFEHK